MQFISRILDLTTELNQAVVAVAAEFTNLEPASDGVMSEGTINDTKGALSIRKNDFDGLVMQTQAILNRASAYVAPVPLSETAVYNDFSHQDSKLGSHIIDMGVADSAAMQHISSFKDRFDSLRADMNQFLSENATGDRINFAGIEDLANKDWYDNNHGNTLLAMWLNDPFVYVEGRGAVWEDQWVTGDIDSYLHLGMSALTGQANFSVEAGTGMLLVSGGASFTGFSMTGGFESQYASGSMDVKVGHAEANMKYGWSEDYFGFNLSGEAVVAAASLSATLGDGILSISGDLSGSVLSANAHATFEFESRYDFQIGAGAKAEVVEGSAGLRLFEVPKTNGGTTNLFAVSASGSAGSAGADFGLRSENVYQNDFIAVNVVSFSGDLALGLGLGVDISFPTICFGNTFTTIGNTIGGWFGWR